MNRRERQSATIIIGAIVLALLIAFIPKASGVIRMETPTGNVYLFTEQEMAMLDHAIGKLKAERDTLQAANEAFEREVKALRRKCI